jgi:hypothetical protein
MIENQKKHKEKSKLSDKFLQPFVTPADGIQAMLGKMSKVQKRKKKRK